MLIKDVTDPEDKAKWEFIQECVKNPDRDNLFLVCEYLYHLLIKEYIIVLMDIKYYNWPKSISLQYKISYYSYDKLKFDFSNNVVKLCIKQ